MNDLYLSIAKVNYQRFFKSPWVWFTGIFLVIMLISTFVMREGFRFEEDRHVTSEMTFIFMWAISLIMFGATFWQYAWAMGNVDARGFHTDANRVDRHFISFMSTLPLSRGDHFLIQLSLYVVTSLIISLFSFGLHVLATGEGEPISLVVYGHILLFAIFLYEGSNQVFIDLPAALQGEIRSLRHPVVIRSMARFVAVVLLLWFVRRYFEQHPDSFPLTLGLSFIDQYPWCLLLLFVLSGLQYWRGFVTFKKIDIV